MTGRVLFSMGASVDGYIADRDGHFAWTVPSEDLFRFHIARVGELGAMICGRRLYETMLVWETDPAMREDPLDAEFADLWRDLPKIVFSGSLTAVQGNARLATNSWPTRWRARLRAPARMWRSVVPIWLAKPSSADLSTSSGSSAIRCWWAEGSHRCQQ